MGSVRKKIEGGRSGVDLCQWNATTGGVRSVAQRVSETRRRRRVLGRSTRYQQVPIQWPAGRDGYWGSSRIKRRCVRPVLVQYRTGTGNSGQGQGCRAKVRIPTKSTPVQLLCPRSLRSVSYDLLATAAKIGGRTRPFCTFWA